MTSPETIHSLFLHPPAYKKPSVCYSLSAPFRLLDGSLPDSRTLEESQQIVKTPSVEVLCFNTGNKLAWEEHSRQRKCTPHVPVVVEGSTCHGEVRKAVLYPKPAGAWKN